MSAVVADGASAAAFGQTEAVEDTSHGMNGQAVAERPPQKAGEGQSAQEVGEGQSAQKAGEGQPVQEGVEGRPAQEAGEGRPGPMVGEGHPAQPRVGRALQAFEAMDEQLKSLQSDLRTAVDKRAKKFDMIFAGLAKLIKNQDKQQRRINQMQQEFNSGMFVPQGMGMNGWNMSSPYMMSSQQNNGYCMGGNQGNPDGMETPTTIGVNMDNPDSSGGKGSSRSSGSSESDGGIGNGVDNGQPVGQCGSQFGFQQFGGTVAQNMQPMVQQGGMIVQGVQPMPGSMVCHNLQSVGQQGGMIVQGMQPMPGSMVCHNLQSVGQQGGMMVQNMQPVPGAMVFQNLQPMRQHGGIQLMQPMHPMQAGMMMAQSNQPMGQQGGAD